MIKKIFIFVVIILGMFSLQTCNINTVHGAIPLEDFNFVTTDTYSNYKLGVFNFNVDDNVTGFRFVIDSSYMQYFSIFTGGLDGSTTIKFYSSANQTGSYKSLNTLASYGSNISSNRMLYFNNYDTLRDITISSIRFEFAMSPHFNSLSPQSQGNVAANIFQNTTLYIEYTDSLLTREFNFSRVEDNFPIVTTYFNVNPGTAAVSIKSDSNYVRFKTFNSPFTYSKIEFYDYYGDFIDVINFEDITNNVNEWFDIILYNYDLNNVEYAKVTFVMANRNYNSSTYLDLLNENTFIVFDRELYFVEFYSESSVIAYRSFIEGSIVDFPPNPNEIGMRFNNWVYADGSVADPKVPIDTSYALDNNIIYLYARFVPRIDPSFDIPSNEGSWLVNIFNTLGITSEVGFVFMTFIILSALTILIVKLNLPIIIVGISAIVLTGVLFFLNLIGLLYVIIALLVFVMTIFIKERD